MSKIEEQYVEDALSREYLNYAGYVLQERAIPDVRDFLKDGARKILWSMHKNKHTAKDGMVKGQAATGEVMKYSVHGDASIYGTMVRMAQPFSLRYPLIHSESNIGSIIAGKDYAAGRYVELKSSKVALEMLNDIGKDTVEWKENYDQTQMMPRVLPAYFPNICNGVTGIGVGTGCSVPQFNVIEVCNALIKINSEKDYTFDDIYCPIDFATGGIIVNEAEVKQSLANGQGKAAKIRAKLSYDGDTNEIIVSELPYQVFTDVISRQLAEKINAGELTQVYNFIDGTNFNGVCIKIKLQKNANIGKAIQELYENTSLQHYFGINLTLLADGKRPQVFTWEEALVAYLEHLKITISKSHEFDYKKIMGEIEINEGFFKALANIDDIIILIKASDNATVACSQLIKKYNFTEVQAKAILNLKLQKLTKLDAIETQNKLEKLKEEANFHNLIFTNQDRLKEVTNEALKSISAKYGDKRRTVNTNIDNDEEIEVEQKDIIVYISNSGAVLANEVNKYSIQNRGGKGTKVKWKSNQDVIWKTISASTTDNLLLFSNKAKAYVVSVKDFMLDEEFYLESLIELDHYEKIVSITPFNQIENMKYIVFATKQGMVKKTEVKEYLNAKRKTGLVAIKLRDDDEVVAIDTIMKDTDKIMLVTNNSKSVLFNQDQVNAQGRSTLGVAGIKLKDNSIVSLVIIPNEDVEILTVTNDGYAKRTKISDITVTNRAIQGSSCHKLVDEQTLVAACLIEKTSEIMAYTKTSIIKLPLISIPLLSKTANGVKIMNIDNLNIKGILKIDN